MGGIAVVLVYGASVVTVDKNSNTSVQQLYNDVAIWRSTLPTSFYLAFGARLLAHDDTMTVGALAVDSKVELVIVEAAQLAKIRVTRVGLKDAIFGFGKDISFESMLAEVESSLPDAVLFPPNCHVINASPTATYITFAKLWDMCKMSEMEFVVDALPKSETIQVRVQIASIESAFISKSGALVGDIFVKAIPEVPLQEFTFTGHNADEITETDWVLTFPSHFSSACFSFRIFVSPQLIYIYRIRQWASTPRSWRPC